MPHLTSSHEMQVLAVLHASGSLTIEQVVDRLTEMNWNQAFSAIDTLSRQGVIQLHRVGYEYVVSLPAGFGTAPQSAA